MKSRKDFGENRAEAALGVILNDQLLFSLFFQRSDLSIEPTAPQKLMILDNSDRILACTSRNVAKTISLIGRVMRDIATYLPRGDKKDQEILITTPTQAQLDPLINRLLSNIGRQPFMKSLIQESNRGDKPRLLTKTRLTIHGRLEGSSGTDVNMTGIHPVKIYADEMSFGCLAPDTCVPIKGGKYKKIKDIELGDITLGYNGREVVPSIVTGKKFNGSKPVYELKTGTRSIKATDNHPFLCAVKIRDGKRGDPSKSSSLWELQWKPLGEIKPDDVIVIARSLPDYSSDVFIDDLEITEGKAELLGMYLGDGCKSDMVLRDGRKNGHIAGISFAIPTFDKAFSECMSLISSEFGASPKVREYEIKINSRKIAEWFRSCGVFGYAKTKRIPDWAYRLSPSKKRALIKGLLLTDGYFNETNRGKPVWYIVLCQKELVEDIRQMAISLNMRVSNINKSTGVNWFFKKRGKGVEQVESYSLTLRDVDGDKLERNYKMVTPRGISRIELPEHLAFERVKSITECGVSDTWDIETSTENFIADGVLVHNSHINHRSRMAGAMPETKWFYAGVPNGVRTTPFYELDQTKIGNDWSHHKFSMLNSNPLFVQSRKYRNQIIKSFGGKNSPDFITQVLGEWGDEAQSSFPPGSISWTDGIPYFMARCSGADIDRALQTGTLAKALNNIPQVRCYRAAVGWDWGYSPDPSTFVLAYQMGENQPWRTYARISLYQVTLPKQVEVLKHLVSVVLGYKHSMISVDNNGAYQTCLSETNKYMFDGRMKLTNQGGAVEIDSDTGTLVTPETKESYDIANRRKEGKIVRMGRKYWLTEQLRRFMLNSILKAEGVQLELGFDPDLENDFVSTVERKTPSGQTIYDVPKQGKVNLDQNLDAVRALIDSIVEVERFGQPVGVDYSGMLKQLGWIGALSKQDRDDGGIKLPWEV